MMEMKIEAGIPIPRSRGREGAGFPTKYPFVQMKVGESILVQDAKQARVCNAAGVAGKRHGMKFTTRTVMVNGQRATRVWRTE